MLELRTYRRTSTLNRIHITAASMRFVAETHQDAPRTVAAFLALLPYQQKLIHVKWSGEAVWSPLGDFDLGVGFEKANARRSECPVWGVEFDHANFGFGSGTVGRAAGQRSFAERAAWDVNRTLSIALRNARQQRISTAHDRSAPKADFGMNGWPSGCSALPSRRRYAPYDCFGRKAVCGQRSAAKRCRMFER